MFTGSRVESIKRKRFDFTRKGVVVKKSPKPGYVFVRFEGDQQDTRMRTEDLAVEGQAKIFDFT